VNFKRVGLETMKITHNSQNSSMKTHRKTQLLRYHSLIIITSVVLAYY